MQHREGHSLTLTKSRSHPFNKHFHEIIAANPTRNTSVGDADIYSFLSPEILREKDTKGRTLMISRFERGLTEGGIFAFVCHYMVSQRPGPATVLSHTCCVFLLVKARPKCMRQSLASTVSALAVAATSYCHAGRHANVVIVRLLLGKSRLATSQMKVA